MKNPFLKFYTRDWQSNPELRLCSLEARGLWIELICVMHRAARCGYLETPQGIPLDDEQTCRLVGTFKGDFIRCRDELIQNGVASVEEGTGVMYCGRMVRDAKKAEKCASAGKKGGGNPNLSPSALPYSATEEVKIPETRSHMGAKVTFKGQASPLSSLFSIFVSVHPECERVNEDDFAAAIRAVGLGLNDLELITSALNDFKINCACYGTFKPASPISKFRNYLTGALSRAGERTTTASTEIVEESPNVKRAREEARLKREASQ